MVDGELLFFFAQLFPDTLRLGDVLFGDSSLQILHISLQ